MSCHLAKKASALEQMKMEAGCFVLLSNAATEGDGAADAREILSLYKEQHGVEQNFAFLKDPTDVNAIFLKSEERIEALGLILLISLLVWRLIERSLRKHVEKTGCPLTGWDNKPTANPTALMVTSNFKNTTVIRIGSQRRLSWIIYLGAYAMDSGWNKVIHRTDRCDLSLFQLGLRLLDHFLNEELFIPVAFTPARTG